MKFSSGDICKQVGKNIYQRAPYSFQVKMMVTGLRIVETFDTLEEACAFRDLKRVVESRLSQKEAAKFTLSAALDRYMTEVTPRKKGAAREIDRIKRWKARTLSNCAMTAIRGKEVADFRDAERKRGLAENSIRLEIALLSQVFETARKEWGMESLLNPCRLIKLPAGSVIDDWNRGKKNTCWPLCVLVAVLPDTKNGEQRVVPLSSKSLFILFVFVKIKFFDSTD